MQKRHTITRDESNTNEYMDLVHIKIEEITHPFEERCRILTLKGRDNEKPQKEDTTHKE